MAKNTNPNAPSYVPIVNIVSILQGWIRALDGYFNLHSNWRRWQLVAVWTWTWAPPSAYDLSEWDSRERTNL